MANLRYVVPVVLASCVLIAIAYLPPRERPSRWSTPRRVFVESYWVDSEDNPELWEAATDLQQLSSRFGTGQRYLSIMERRDSVVTSLPAALTLRAGLNVVAASDVPPKALDLVRSFAMDLTGRFPADEQATPMALAVVLDTLPPRTAASGATITHSVPTARSNICLTTVVLGQLSLRELGRPSVRAEQIVRTTATRLLGVCAYVGRFGEPGEQVAQWLRQSRYAPAVVAEWLLPPQDRAPRSLRGSSYYTGYSWYLSLDRVRCAAGELDACSDMAAGDEPWLYTTWSDPGAPSDLVVSDRRQWEYQRHALGGNVVRYLSDLVIDMGEDRFQQFWRSDLSLEEAFARAFGLTIGEWTMQWVRDQVGIRRTGPRAPAAVTTLSLLLTVIFVGGGVAFSVRRQVG